VIELHSSLYSPSDNVRMSETQDLISPKCSSISRLRSLLFLSSSSFLDSNSASWFLDENVDKYDY
jgi:hypothetical protein